MLLGHGLHERQIETKGTPRVYLVHVPQSYDPATRFPLIVVLHGGGGSAAFASRVYGWRELSHREECLIAFPEATCEDPTRSEAVRENPRIWNDGSTRSAVARRNEDDIGYLQRVLDDVQTHFSVDDQQIFMTGFSNGASMTFRAGVQLSDRVAAIAPVSGHLCLIDPQPARALSMLYIIGLEDPLNPIAGGRTTSPWGKVRHRPPVMDSILRWVRLIDAPENPEIQRDEAGVKVLRYGPGKTGQEVHFCTIAGQGHEWPGARRTLPRSISGPQTDKLNTTQAVWNFFATAAAPARRSDDEAELT